MQRAAISKVYLHFHGEGVDPEELEKGNYMLIKDVDDYQQGLYDKTLMCFGCGIEWFSIENKGKEICQPHHLLEDIKAISENDRKKLTEGVFGDIIRFTPVRSSNLFDVNGYWSGSSIILPEDKPIVFYTEVDTQNCQVQSLATP
ncbi:hypothetical protein GIB67_018347 [Kingdonia uniflora]|uniref:Glycosyl hydrolase family 32 N-terminal domain-containing protein n=1 Tax=Kingdonia uniflora TaxID=39325 RepID=A0A7J7MJD4_9MAGN|nr:hypothetical protein GIB67_018347 [Kingdonia uniflora]